MNQCVASPPAQSIPKTKRAARTFSSNVHATLRVQGLHDYFLSAEREQHVQKERRVAAADPVPASSGLASPLLCASAN